MLFGFQRRERRKTHRRAAFCSSASSAGKGAKHIDVQPGLVAESLFQWAAAYINTTPECGEFCDHWVVSHIAYLGMCATKEQKDFIHMQWRKQVLDAMTETTKE